jgi:hypothetical protein
MCLLQLHLVQLYGEIVPWLPRSGLHQFTGTHFTLAGFVGSAGAL